MEKTFRRGAGAEDFQPTKKTAASLDATFLISDAASTFASLGQTTVNHAGGALVITSSVGIAALFPHRIADRLCSDIA